MLQLQIATQKEEVELLCNLLEETESSAITLTDQFDDPILEPEVATTPLWQHVIIQAFYEEDTTAKAAYQFMSNHVNENDLSITLVPEKDWQRECMDQFQPMQFGKNLWVCPSWATPPHPEAVNLILDPGLAFGTGTHATTALCLEWLETTDLKDKTLIDYGCGSGILAIAALKLGAKHVYAVDIDEQALLATKNNAKANHISEKNLSIGQPDDLDIPVDILVANILLSPLLSLQKRFKRLLKSDGQLLVSGILENQLQDLKRAYQTNFHFSHHAIREDWARAGLVINSFSNA